MNFTKIDTVQNEIKKQNNKICRKNIEKNKKSYFHYATKIKLNTIVIQLVASHSKTKIE